MKEIEEVQFVTDESFESQLKPLNRPLVFRGLCADWPVIAAAKQSAQKCADYICSFADDNLHRVAVVPFEEGGKIHYNKDIDGVNFSWETASLREYFDVLFEEIKQKKPQGIALQSLQVANMLDGFDAANKRKLAPSHAMPHMWIGNQLKVATHADTVDNLAICVAGVRRFTVFAPDEVSNLYIGPLHFTPAGPPISMVHLTEPDFDRYPKFEKALANAQYVDLYPGDALYLPFRWYHHVESKTDFNILLNYWWSDARDDTGSALTAFLHALVSVSTLPPHQRAAWGEIFDNFVFQKHGDPWEHLPEHVRSKFAKADKNDLKELQSEILTQIKESWNIKG